MQLCVRVKIPVPLNFKSLEFGMKLAREHVQVAAHRRSERVKAGGTMRDNQAKAVEEIACFESDRKCVRMSPGLVRFQKRRFRRAARRAGDWATRCGADEE